MIYLEMMMAQSFVTAVRPGSSSGQAKLVCGKHLATA